MLERRPIFQAVRALRKGQGFTLDEVKLLDAAIDEALRGNVESPLARRQVNQRGIELMHQFEGCKLEAYPDPGSKDGHPWTIGFGSTGEGIHKGVVWSREQCEERFAADLAKFAAGVDKLIGDAPTTSNQFSAMCSLAYNIGLSAFQRSTVLRKHKAGDYKNAARAFLLWNKNDGQVMRGLTRRRLAESEFYSAP